jgi:3-isopropylmalate/(R)-2-methylmalate dehydratase small subunit
MTSRSLVRGNAWVFGDDVSGDDGIIDFAVIRDETVPSDEAALGRMCCELIRPGFSSMVQEGDIMVAGVNFVRNNHPQVPVAIKGCGLRAVVCESTNTTFIRKSLNIGLGVMVCPGVTEIAVEGDEMEVDFAKGTVTNLRTGESRSTKPFMDMMVQILDHDGLVPYLTALVASGEHRGAPTGAR